MKKTTKRTAAVALTGVLAAGMLAGCGDAKLDGTKTVATVNGTEVPMGIVSLYAREQQAQTEAMYLSFMGSTAGIWSQEADEETGKTYGEQAVEAAAKQVELMYILKEKAADYGVEVTEEDQAAISEAAAAFMEANDEDTIASLAVTEDQVKTLLELETYQTRIYDPIVADADTSVTDEEAQQSSFTYVCVSTSGDELTDDEIAAKKEQAQSILDKLKEDPTADMEELAKAEDETYSALSGTYTTTPNDEDTSSYPDAVLEVLRGLSDGEVGPDVIEGDAGFYVVRLDKANDEEATASKKESLKSSKESAFYTETTDGWMDDADIKEDSKVLKTLKIDDTHTFSIKAAAAADTTAATVEDTAETTATPEVTEEAEATEAPEATATTALTATEAPEATEAAKATATPTTAAK